MKLYIVRHGETFENVNKITQGHINSRLTPNGEEQARRIALRLRDEKMDFCYSSDLERCVRTAQEILKFHPEVELITSCELREQAKGIYEGKPKGESQKEIERLGQEWWQFLPEGGETMGSVWDKVVGFYEEIIRKHPNDLVLVVSHGGPISCLLSYLHRDTLMHIENYATKRNTAVSIINVDEKGKCDFESLNCAEHLS